MCPRQADVGVSAPSPWRCCCRMAGPRREPCRDERMSSRRSRRCFSCRSARSRRRPRRSSPRRRSLPRRARRPRRPRRRPLPAARGPVRPCSRRPGSRRPRPRRWCIGRAASGSSCRSSRVRASATVRTGRRPGRALVSRPVRMARGLRGAGGSLQDAVWRAARTGARWSSRCWAADASGSRTSRWT